MQSIVALIGATVPLRKRGTEFWGLCPFHREKTPSLAVNEQKGLWLCRSCGKGGDAITWVRESRHVGYREACQILGRLDTYKPDPALVAAQLETQAREKRWQAFLARWPEMPEHCRCFIEGM
jgi:DNA primase